MAWAFFFFCFDIFCFFFSCMEVLPQHPTKSSYLVYREVYLLVFALAAKRVQSILDVHVDPGTD
jgi:hypothetical protein